MLGEQFILACDCFNLSVSYPNSPTSTEKLARRTPVRMRSAAVALHTRPSWQYRKFCAETIPTDLDGRTDPAASSETGLRLFERAATGSGGVKHRHCCFVAKNKLLRATQPSKNVQKRLSKHEQSNSCAFIAQRWRNATQTDAVKAKVTALDSDICELLN